MHYFLNELSLARSVTKQTPVVKIEEEVKTELEKGYYKTKLEVASRLMASMMSNSEIYSWSGSKDNDEIQKQLEDDLVVVAHDLAVKLIRYCSPVPTDD